MKDYTPIQNPAEQAGAFQGEEAVQATHQQFARALSEVFDRLGQYRREFEPTPEFRRVVDSYRTTLIELASDGAGGELRDDRRWRLPELNPTASGQSFTRPYNK